MKKKFVIVVIAALFVCIGLSGCFDDNRPDHSALDDLGYSNTLYGFGLNPPDGWTVDESNPDLIVAFMGPTFGNGTVNIGIAAGQLETGKTLYDSAMELMVQYLDIFLGEYTLNSAINRTINGMNTCEIVYTIIQNEVQVRQKQVWIEKNGKTLILSYSAILDVFDTYDTVFEESLSSVVILW